MTQVSEEIEGRVTKKISSQELTRIESRILGAVLNSDVFLNSQVRVKLGTAPGTSRDTDRENQERKEDRSQKDPNPEVGTTVNRSPHSGIRL